MREIVLDTETTGLDVRGGHRIIEIGAVELVNHIPSGETFHAYINPERQVDAGALDVHGLSNAFLADKPLFSAIAGDFLAFIDGAALVIHNASFDIGFLNAELERLALPPLLDERVVDTLYIARQRHPMGPNSLDALCRRYNVDNSKRDKHGALLDAELLADVYIELIGARQPHLTLIEERASRSVVTMRSGGSVRARPRPLAPRITTAELEAHRRFIATLGEDAIWNETADRGGA